MPHKFNVLTQNIHTLRLSVGGRTHGRTENIYSIFRDELLLLGEHVFKEAKAWMEWRLAAMKNGVPKADAAELARDWLY